MRRSLRSGLATIFERSLSLPPEARARFLDEACDGDDDLRRELESLLAAHQASSGFFEHLEQEILAPALAAVVPHSDEALPAADATFPYRIVSQLGAGGMGVVYKALDLRLGRTVALKFVPATLAADPAARARLRDEARAASALDSPHIGVIHEIGETRDGQMFIVMAHYEGRTLHQMLADGPLAVSEALDLAMQLARALAVVHRHSIVHRDVKPSNVFVTRDGVAKLLDFGVAKVTGGDASHDGSGAGTVAYMSPEQTRGEAVDERTDLWSLGVVLHEIVTGRRPFDRDDARTTVDAIRNSTWLEPAVLRAPVLRRIAPIIGRCLEKDRDRRYPHAEALLEDLQASAAALDAAAVPPAGVFRAVARRAAPLAALVSAVLLMSPESDAESLYRAGRYYLDKRDEASTYKALELFRRTLDADPSSARAWAGRADAYQLLAWLRVIPPSEAYAAMRPAAKHALALDDTLPEAHVSMATVLAEQDLDAEAAVVHTRRALELDEDHAPAHRQYAAYLRLHRTFDAALEHLEIAEQLDPHWRTTRQEIGVTLYMAERYDEALDVLLRYQQSPDAPRDDVSTYFFIAAAHAQLGDFEAALAALDKATPTRETWPSVESLRLYVHARAGNVQRAWDGLAELERRVSTERLSPWYAAVVHIGLGEIERAIDLLEEAFDWPTRQMRLLPVEPIFAGLRGQHERFDALVARVLGQVPSTAAEETL
jgi:eukaryotic-like serine/threonine-protein kinase